MGAEPEFRDVGLTDEDRPRRPQPGDHDRIGLRDPLGEDGRALGEREPADGIEILDREGKAVKRPHRLAPGQGGIRLRRLAQQVIPVPEGDDGVEGGVQASDPVQIGLHHFRAGDRPAADRGGEVNRAEGGDAVRVRHAHALPIVQGRVSSPRKTTTSVSSTATQVATRPGRLSRVMV